MVVLVSTIVNASSAHLGIEKTPLARVPVARPANTMYNHQLEKHDDESIDTWFALDSGHFMTYIRTSALDLYELIVDTGSAYTWVGNNPSHPYHSGPASEATGQRVTIAYGDGTSTVHFTGTTYNDLVTLDDVLTITSQSIGVADRPGILNMPGDFDGILGLGPTILTAKIADNGNAIATVIDNLFYVQRTISHAVVGVYFEPYADGGGGTLSFGKYDDSVLTSGVSYVPVTDTHPASAYWGVDGSVMYNGNTILEPTSGIVDTGSHRIKIVSDAFLAYLSATGSTLDSDGWPTLTQEQYNNVRTLSFVIGGHSYDLSPNAQIYPRSLYGETIFLVVHDQLRSSGSGVDFTHGYPFVQRYYTVFNTSSAQIGFAKHTFTDSTSN
ncbi:hypothetical protein ID866_8616 [Astraeus odoratus]|nr:hypothetical protein ID866_8616 [Astraeus odoratus]